MQILKFLRQNLEFLREFTRNSQGKNWIPKAKSKITYRDHTVKLGDDIVGNSRISRLKFKIPKANSRIPKTKSKIPKKIY